MKISIIVMALVAAPPCWAVLGGPPSLSGPAVQSSAASTGSGASYTDLQSQLPNGIVAHEYASASGTVFAVSWSGPFPPDLKALLGPWFDTYTEQAALRKDSGRSHMAVRDADLVVVSTGRMGAFQGRAWLVSLLPKGFNPEEMR
jgi:hypothetical protein